MKKKILLFALMAILLVAGVTATILFSSALATNVKISATTVENAKIGDTVTVNIDIADLDFAVEGITLQLAWDPAKLQGVSATFGTIINSEAVKQKTVDANLTGGIFRLTIAETSGLAFSADGVTAITSGTIASLQLTVLAGASAENEIELTVESIGTGAADYKDDCALTNGSVKLASSSNIVYIADVAKGTGDGSSAANAMGNSDEYNTTINGSEPPISNSIYYGSALYKAAKELGTTGGTIVICDDITLKIGDSVDVFGKTSNFFMPANDQPITITSLYDGVDYRTSAGAELYLSTEQYNFRLHLTGKTIWENLDIVRTYITERISLSICCRGRETLFGDGLNVTQLNTTTSPAVTTTTTAVYPDIYGGNMWGNTNSNINVTINSGTWYRLASVSFATSGAGDINGDAEYTINGGTFKGVVVGTTHNVSLGQNYCRITGNYTLNINGGVISSVSCTTNLDSRAYTIDPATYEGYGNIEGDVVVNITGGTIVSILSLTPAGHKYRKDATEDTNGKASLNVKNGFGQIGGNATVNISGNPTFNRVDLGAMAFKITSTNSKFILKMNGDQWKATSGTLNTFAFVGGGSNVATEASYRYSIIDFSGMTYDQYWNKKMDNTDKNLINSAYYLFTDATVTPTIAPEGITAYGRGKAAYGFNEVVEPIANPATGITVKTNGKTAYTVGETFDKSGFVFTVTYANSTTADILGTDAKITIDKTDALALTDTSVTASFTYGTTVTVNIPITVANPTVVTMTDLAVKTPFTKTAYTVGETLDLTGLVLEATYSDSSKKTIDIADVTVTPAVTVTLTTAHTAVTFSYTEGGVTKTATVNITVTTPTTTNTTIYISDNGTGDGSTPASPLGNGALFPTSVSVSGNKVVDQNGLDISGLAYQDSALYRALDALKGTGGTIVIVGPTTIAYATNNDTDSSITEKTSGNWRSPIIADGKTITITSFYEGIDYRTSGNAVLIYDTTYNNPRVHFQGESIWENLKLKVVYNSTYWSSGTPNFAFKGYATVLGDDISCVQYDSSNGSEPTTSSRYPMVISGNIWGNLNSSSNLTINSGTWYTAYSSNQFGGASVPSVQTGDATLTINGGTFKGTMFGVTTSISTGGESATACTIDGNINITINGGEMTMIMLGRNGFVNPESQFKLNINGGSYKSPFAAIFWGSGGSAFLSGTNKGMRILDFSGMTLAEYNAEDHFTANTTPASLANSFYTAATISGIPGRGVDLNNGFEQVIVPSSVAASKIEIKTSGKTYYVIGEKFDASGFVFTVTNSDSTTADILGTDTKITVSKTTSLTETDTKITVSYTLGGVTVTCDITIVVEEWTAALTSLAVKTPFTKTSYYVGEKLNLAGLVLEATFSDASTKTVALEDVVVTPVNGATLEASNNKVTFSYTFKGITKTAEVSITVTTITSVTVTVNPTKTTYKNGETIDLTGLVISINGVDTVVDMANVTIITPANGIVSENDTEIVFTYTVGSYTSDPITIVITVVTGSSSYYDDMLNRWVSWTSQNLFTVKFVDHDGTLLAEKQVRPYSHVIAPEAPKRAGYTFIGWDKSLDEIKEDTIVTALYKENAK